MGAPELLQFALAGLKNGSIYALVALGFTIVYASTGVINFAQGEFVMLGGMLSVWAYTTLGLSLPLAGLVGVLATAAIGIAFELLAIRPRKDGDPLALIIITVGGSMLLSSLARHVFGPTEKSLPRFSEGSIRILGASLERQSLWIFGIAAIAVGLLTLMYSRTRFGKAMRACAIDRSAAQTRGYRSQDHGHGVVCLGCRTRRTCGTCDDASHADGVRCRSEVRGEGVCRGDSWRARQSVRRGTWRFDARADREPLGRLHLLDVQRRDLASGAVARAVRATPGTVRRPPSGEGVTVAKATTRRETNRRVGAGLTLAAAVVVAIMPLLVTGTDARYVLKILTFVGINVLIVTGLALLFGYAGQVSLGHAGFYGLGAYVVGVRDGDARLPVAGRSRSRDRGHGTWRCGAGGAEPAPQGALSGDGHARFR